MRSPGKPGIATIRPPPVVAQVPSGSLVLFITAPAGAAPRSAIATAVKEIWSRRRIKPAAEIGRATPLARAGAFTLSGALESPVTVLGGELAVPCTRNPL